MIIIQFTVQMLIGDGKFEFKARVYDKVVKTYEKCFTLMWKNHAYRFLVVNPTSY
jgi:hypothetical protein